MTNPMTAITGMTKTRGMKYAEAKIVKIARGETTALEIIDKEVYDSALVPICAYIVHPDCPCETLTLKRNMFTLSAFIGLAPCFHINKSIKTFSYIQNKIGDFS